MKMHIIDWVGNVCFQGQSFNTFDDAEDFLTAQLGLAYDIDRGEYIITEVSHTGD